MDSYDRQSGIPLVQGVPGRMDLPSLMSLRSMPSLLIPSGNEKLSIDSFRQL